MKNIIALFLISFLLAGCNQTEPTPTVGKVLGVQQVLGTEDLWEVGIMVHANFVPYCTNDIGLAERAKTMVAKTVYVDSMTLEGGACPVLINVTPYSQNLEE